jgi:DNA recombination protein RmuC
VESPWLVIAVGTALAVLLVLLVVALLRLGELLRAARESASAVSRLDAIAAQNERLERGLRAELIQARTEAAANAKTAREEVGGALSRLTQTSEQRLEAVRATVEQRLESLRADNAQKLEQMRATVDEKLHATLEQRLGQSFKQVSDWLEQVHKGLGEMQSLAAGVGDLKRVLTNVKTRGTWGEVQLENLLEQILVPSQYEKNVSTRPGASERVEFAIRLPGRDAGGPPCFLPIDAKFPLADYQQLLEAQDRADAAMVELHAKALERRIRDQAADIHAKYVAPPHTTDFALLYLPLEGLYAEVLRRPGLFDALQREYRVNVTGPTTLAAMLNSLQMGFRTLAIEQRSSEVWKHLAAVKTEFAKFGEVLAATRKKLEQASNSIGDAEVRTRAIERQLRDVEALPPGEAARLLDAEPGVTYGVEDAGGPSTVDPA